MKTKLKKAEFDKESGISKVTISTEFGEFIGISKLHKEDQDIASSFAGCKYAEARAMIKYIKTKKRYIKYQIKILQDLTSELSIRKDYNKISIENRKIRKKIYQLKNSLKILDEKIASLSEKLYKDMEERRTIVEKITNKGDKK